MLGLSLQAKQVDTGCIHVTAVPDVGPLHLATKLPVVAEYSSFSDLRSHVPGHKRN
jgi:hypothetical protein